MGVAASPLPRSSRTFCQPSRRNLAKVGALCKVASMAGSVMVEWHGRRVAAAAPDPLARFVPVLTDRTVRRTEQAAASVLRAADRAAGVLETAARLLLREEGLASSAIEGLRASAEAVALAEAAADDASGFDDHVAAWVADNLAVVSDALADPGTLDEARLFGWHARLMRNSPTIDDRHVGAYRDALGWVGGANPLVAAHVAVPHEDIAALMRDLFAFVDRDDIDPVTQAAVAHAQFETIHPFADGNGRLGRVIISRILARRLWVRVPPPVSLELARDVGGYQAGLTLFRQGFVDQWVSRFSDAVEGAASRTTEVLAAVADLQVSWRDAVSDRRSDSAARRLVELLPAHPVVSARMVAELLDVSAQAARSALEDLAARGVLAETTTTAPRGRGRPRRWWVASDLLGLLGR